MGYGNVIQKPRLRNIVVHFGPDLSPPDPDMFDPEIRFITEEVYSLRKKSREILWKGVIPVDVISFERIPKSQKRSNRVRQKAKKRAETTKAYWKKKHTSDYEGFFIAYGGLSNDMPVVWVEDVFLRAWQYAYDFERQAFQSPHGMEHVGYLRLLRSPKGKKVWTIENEWSNERKAT
jgi:hypothetical protein